MACHESRQDRKVAAVNGPGHVTWSSLVASHGRHQKEIDMSYEVLARKWRPLTFDDVVGQEHISRTLKMAVESDRVSHAYLFSGPRGCGKTSTCLLYTSDAADERSSVDLGGRRI